MNKLKLTAILSGLLITMFLSAQPKRVLIFAKTAGYHHNSIEKAMPILHDACARKNVLADTTRKDLDITPTSLKKYKAVIFLNTTGDILDDDQQKTIEDYVKAGGGFVGIHAATDTEVDWPWYNKMVGATFLSHPEQQKAVINVVDRTHPTTSFLPEKWERTDEWYNFKNINDSIHVLAYLDETSYKGGENGEKHPVIWWQEIEKGRSFYTAVGHTDESYKEPLVIQHIMAAIMWAGKMK
jgi:type 1 glutamine amidotransferase